MNINPLKMYAVTSRARVASGKKKLLQVKQTVKLGIVKTLNIGVVQLNQEYSLNKLSKEV